MKKLTRLTALSCLSNAFMLSTVFVQNVSAHHAPNHFINDLSQAMENASDTCKDALPPSLQSGQGIAMMVGSNCAVMTRLGYEALQNANLSPRGYNLATDRGFMRYLATAERTLARDGAFMLSIQNAAQYTPRDTLQQIIYGIVGVYLYLDYGIDPNTGLLAR